MATVSKRSKKHWKVWIDYTFWFNLAFAFVAIILLAFNFKAKEGTPDGSHEHGSDNTSIKRIVVYLFAIIILIGFLIHLFYNL